MLLDLSYIALPLCVIGHSSNIAGDTLDLAHLMYALIPKSSKTNFANNSYIK